jgi:hypothetical protein
VSEPTQLPDDLPFDDWVAYVFDHEDPDWNFKEDCPYWNEERNARLALSHMGRLFANPEILIGRFSPDQIGVGLNYLLSSGLSGHVFAVFDDTIPLEERLSVIRTIPTLYEKLLAKICARRLSHGVSSAPPDDTRADYICYMLWDVIPLFGRTRNPFTKTDPDVRSRWSEHEAIERACLETIERILEIEHVACKESAIHGIGHWADAYPRWAAETVKRAKKRGLIPPELDSYARAAAKGCVL